MEFTPKKYLNLKKRLARKYQIHLKNIMKEAKYSELATAAWFLEQKELFATYQSQHWFFLNYLSTLLFLENHEFTSSGDKISQEDDFVFEIWNKSEFADIFLKKLNKNTSLAQASFETLVLYDQHVLSLGQIHLTKEVLFSSVYRPQITLGEVKNKTLLATTLHLDGKELKLYSHNLKEMKNFSSRIHKALKLIEFYSPTSWERFSHFTDVIVPIKQSEFVSFSQQDFPGVSMINLYDRDFVDLLDDLLHENGHHHLNYYLNLDILIEEPVDQIYYSPWRRTLRPLRGIYHAYFTFFWAFKLFADMIEVSADHELHTFSKVEWHKIRYRMIEEYHMLNYSFNDLKWARKKGLIHDAGWKLIEDQQMILAKYKTKITKIEKNLVGYKKELSSLKKTLESAKKKYLKGR